MEQARAIAEQFQRLYPVPKEPLPPDRQELLDRIDKLERSQ